MAKTKQQEDYSQEYFESKIIEYQEAILTGNKSFADEVYHKICNIYHPEKYINLWQRQYLYLYDSRDDFIQDYMRIFVITLKKWKPRDSRNKSRYNGTGAFKNYFWSSLHHNYINLVKSTEGAAKRNITTQCPECGEWVNPISTHIIKKHPDLLWQKLQLDNLDIHNVKTCPFCSTGIYRGKTTISENELVKRHILSKHLHLLFDVFYEKHHNFISGNNKLTSAETMFETSGEECLTVYDITPAPMSILDKIVNSDLSPVQQKIIDNILSKSSVNIKYSKSMYNCSEDEFNEALEQLRERIILMEDSIGKH